MSNYLDMLLDESGDLQSTLNQLTEDFNQRTSVALEESHQLRGHHYFGGEFITYSRLDLKDDPTTTHRTSVCYRHLAKLHFNKFVKELSDLYGGDVKNIPASVVISEDLVIDAFEEACVRLVTGDLARCVMTHEAFLELYKAGGEREVMFIDQTYVNLEAFLFNSREDMYDGALPHLIMFVDVGKWVTAESGDLVRESIENRCFHNDMEVESPI
jgi:hypothetical protein